MKAIAILLLASLPVPQVHFSRIPETPHFAQQAKAAPRKGGQWYFARTGHAVFCYGPVMTVPTAAGDIERVATFCKGGHTIVPLRD